MLREKILEAKRMYEKIERLDAELEYEKIYFKEISYSKQKCIKTFFAECLFERCDFTEAVFSACTFDNCIFVDCLMPILKMPDTKMIDPIFLRCKLTGIDWTQLKNPLHTSINLTFLRCDLSYSVFEKIDISSSKMKRCKVYEAAFTEVKAKKCSFRRSDFRRTSFIKSLFINSDFRKAINYRINIAENICRGAKFNYPEVLNLLEEFGVVVEE